MANARMLATKLGLVLLTALALNSCVANGEYLGGRRGLTAGNTVFDITKFGAKGDGSSMCSKAFIMAWIQACASPTPATILIPKGNFLTGPVIFAGPCKSKITIDVKGTVTATTSGFASPEWILFEYVDNIVLTGGGTFHGRGEAVWAADGCGQKAVCNLPPTSLKFRHVKNADVNNIVSINAKAFHMFLSTTEHFSIKNIKLVAPAESPNTDGIHLSNSVHTTILDSLIETGDDCVSVGRGSVDVLVERVTCGPGHGISIGSLGKYKNEEDVSGVHVRNCTLKNTDNGARIKTWGGSGPSKASDISFEDIIMENVKNPIIIDQEYGSRKGDSRVEISNVLFKNIRGTSITKDVIQFVCSKSLPCKGVTVQDVTLDFVGRAKGGKLVGAICNSAKVIFGGKHNFPLCP